VPFGIGIPELLILLVVLLLVFGAKRLPEMGRSLGRGMREFKEGVSGSDQTVTKPPSSSVTQELPPAQGPAEPGSAHEAPQSEAEHNPVR
jgi:TatA/E family protein of Tat protein translocase